MRQKQPRIHDEKHLRFIRSLPSLITMDNTSTEAAHIRYADITRGKRAVGVGEKPDDRWTVPLSSELHREQHSMSERAFWQNYGIDPITVAKALYEASGDYERGCKIVATVGRPVNVLQAG